MGMTQMVNNNGIFFFLFFLTKLEINRGVAFYFSFKQLLVGGFDDGKLHLLERSKGFYYLVKFEELIGRYY